MKIYPYTREGFTIMKKRYALVGTGGRAEFFYGAIVKDFQETSELVAICDVNQTRMNFTNGLLVNKYEYNAVPTYKADQSTRLISPGWAVLSPPSSTSPLISCRWPCRSCTRSPTRSARA